MAKSRTFKNFKIEGIEGTYHYKVSVNTYKLTIQEYREDGTLYKATNYIMDTPMNDISKKQALQLINDYNSDMIEHKEI